MRILLLTIILTISSLPLAAANHACGPVDNGSTTTGTLTVSDTGYECHSTYFGPDYFYDQSYGSQDKTVGESTTGASVRLHQGHGDGSGADTSSTWSGGYNDWSVEARNGGAIAYASASGSENRATGGCSGYDGVNAGAWNNDIGAGSGAQAQRGTARTIPCLAVNPHTFL